ncbi:MAG: hypothetical protein AAFR47_02715 [Pseudomonadota bacterium]
MTALTQYARLECPGLWRPDPTAQRIEVVVSFGDASLVISDKAGRALTHWSLAAVARINPEERPALYTPSAEALEVLEIADDTMVDAVETVRRAVIRARPRSGRVRGLGVAAVAVALLVVSVWWLPGALVRHAATVLPAPTRAALDAGLYAAIARVAGQPCSSPRGERALDRLAARIGLSDGAGALDVMPQGVGGVIALPGGHVLVGRTLVEDHETPEVLAGFVIAERVRTPDPLVAFLSDAGLRVTVRVLTTGRIPQDAVMRWAERRVAATPVPPPAEILLPAFASAEIPSSPYAYARDMTGETVLPLIEGDPMRGQTVSALLPDGDWVALQNICEG